MSIVRKAARNTGTVLVGNVIFRIISLFVMIYLARYLGTAEFGKFNFVFAYVAFFEVFTDLGFQAILVRDLSRDQSVASKLVGNALIIRLILTTFAVIMASITITIVGYPQDTTTYVYIAAFTLFFISLSYFFSTIFQANLKMKYEIFAKLSFKILSAILIFWIIFSQGTLKHIMIALMISEAVKMLISYHYSRRFVNIRFNIDFELWKYLFRESLPIALYGVIYIIYYRIDMVMLSYLVGDTAVGLYSAAYRLSEPLLLIPVALIGSLFPMMSKYFEVSKEKLIISYKLGIKYLLILMLPISIGTLLLADKIILLIYGASFAGSATALQILIWSLVFNSLNFILLSLLISINMQKLNTLSIAICAVINIVLNFILIPKLSYNGASIATVSTNALLFVISFYFVSKHLQFISIRKIAIKPIIGGLVMGIFVYHFLDVSMFLLVPFALIVYSASLLLLKTFSEEDMKIFRRALDRRA